MQVLEDTAIYSRVHLTIFHMLRSLCTEHGHIPESIFLPPESVELISERHRPQETGGFADVYLGVWQGRRVGIKAVKMCSRDPYDKLVKVLIHSTHSPGSC